MIDEDELLAFFMSEMDRGLAGEPSSLAMLPAYVSGSCTVVPGEKVIVIDAGGTNLRTSLVSFDADLNPVKESFSKRKMPGTEGMRVTAAEYFSAIADAVEPLISESDKIGFCYSYAAEITPEGDGIATECSKEVDAPEIVGKRVGRSLLDELERRGIDVSKKKLIVLNDTVATLLAAKVKSGREYEDYIGFILGTGTNTAYMEKVSAIGKFKDKFSAQKMAVNVESGCLDYSFCDVYREFWQTTADPSGHHLEKLISGAYLGAMCGFIIEKAIESGSFTEDFIKKYRESGLIISTAFMSNYLESIKNPDKNPFILLVSDYEDGKALLTIFRTVIACAAKLSAVNLLAMMLKTGSGHNPLHPICINADGSTFYKTIYLKNDTEKYLNSFCKRYGIHYEIISVDDSPTLGAAVAAMAL